MPQLFLSLTAALALLIAWLELAALLSARRRGAGKKLFTAWILFLLIGCALGIRFAFFPIRLNSIDQMTGLPLPAAAYRLDQGQWIEMDYPYRWALSALDLIYFILAALAPISTWLWIAGWRSRRPEP